MSRTSPQNLLHIPRTDPPRRIIGRLFWLVQHREHPGSNKCSPTLSLLWSSLIVSNPVRTFLISRDLWYSLILAQFVLRTLVSLSRCSSTIRTLCYRRETRVHDSPTLSNLGNHIGVGGRMIKHQSCRSWFFLSAYVVDWAWGAHDQNVSENELLQQRIRTLLNLPGHRQRKVTPRSPQWRTTLENIYC